MNTSELMQLAKVRFAPPDYGLLADVGNGTGTVRRRCDALAMGIWKSRGHTLHGIELKVSRSDWLRELKNPAKADLIFRYCDFWWLVVADRSIVADGELPETWGLLAPHGETLTTIVQAPRLPKPEPVDRNFLAAMFRRAVEQSVDSVALNAARAEGEKLGRQLEQRNVDHQLSQFRRLQERVDAFKKTSGVNIEGYEGAQRIGGAVRMVLDGEHMPGRKELERIRATAQRVLDSIDEVLPSLKQEC